MKKTFKNIITLMLVLTCVISSMLVNTTTVSAATKITESVYVNNKLTLKKGKTYTLKMNYDASKLNFKSSNTKVATIDKKGKIKAKSVGSAKITVTLKKNTKVKTTISLKVNLEGPQVVQGSTAKTSFGVKIPVVSEFNKVALDPNNSWTGSGESTDFSKAFGKALKEYSEAANYGIHDSPIQDSGVDTLHNGMAFDDMGPVTLMRDTDKGCYYFYYTADLNDLGKTNTKYNRDLSLFLLSLVTSTPKEVEKAIYESAFTAPNGKEPIPSDRTWTKIGDCEVRFTWSKSDPVILEYAIRPCK